jgi:hypothetical protein
MTFLKKPPVDLNARRIDLQQRLQNAETTLETLRHDAVARANDDSGKLSDMASAAWKAEFEIAALRAALDQIDLEIAEAAEKARLDADRKLREQTSRDLNARADRGQKIIKPLMDALAAVHTWLQDDAEAILGVVGMKELAGNLHRELPPGIELMIAEIRARAEATLAGKAPTTLPAPPVLTVIEETPEPETLEIFANESLYWKDHRGQPARLDVHHIGQLPVHAAKIALARGVAFKLDDPRYLTMRETAKKTGWPHLLDPQRVIDLDRPEGTTAIYSSSGKKLRDESAPQFQVFDRGPPRQAMWTIAG